MNALELILCALALSMDAFAVSICCGLGLEKIRLRDCATVGLWFGVFQALMPAIGFLCGSVFGKYITPVDHWIAFILLGLIGVNMIRESFGKEEEGKDYSLKASVMFTLAVATSIDAFAVGITFALLENVNLPLALSLIFFITFLMSALGVKIGGVFGSKFKSKAEFLGGTVLVLLGLKILLEHLGVISF